MLGTLWGTDGYFHSGNAATAYGVGVISVDGSDDAGRIIEWIDPSNGHYYGESSGPVSSPYGDGLAFVNRFGTSRVNPQTVAIEISGNQTTPLDDPAIQAIAKLSAYYADRRKIGWDAYPAVPDESRNFTIYHQEFTIGTGKECPFEVVMAEIEQIIAATVPILKQAQTGGTPEPEPEPPPVNELPDAEPFDTFAHGVTTQTDQHDGPDYYQYIERRFTVAPERTGTMRVSPDKSLPVIKTLPAGKQINSAFMSRQDSIDWILDADGYSWQANSFNPKIPLPMKSQPA